MKKKSILMITLCTFIIFLAIVLIKLQMNDSVIKVNKKQENSKGEKITIETKSNKDISVKLYKKIEEKTEFEEVIPKKKKENLLKDTSTFEIEAKDLSSPDNVTDIKSTIADNYIIISFSPAKDNSTLYEYYIESNNENEINKSNITTIYSDSGIKGYNYIIDNSIDTKAGVNVNKTDSTPILYSGIEWDKDYYLHIRAIDNSDNYSESITYKIDLPSNGVRLKYVDLNSNSEISPEETIIGVVNEKYDANFLQKDIQGYKLVNIDGEVLGKLKKERINVKYNYAKKANLKIKYLDNQNNEILEPNIIDGYEGKEYNVLPKKIEGYICKDTKASGKMQSGEEEIIFTYEKLGNVITSYIDEVTGKCIKEDETKVDVFGKDYETEEKEIEGYELSNIEGNTEGIIDSENIKVIYYYKKIVDLTIKYIDISTNKLLKEEKISGREGENILIEPESFEGYILAKDKENILKEDETEYTKEVNDIQNINQEDEEDIIEELIKDDYETEANNEDLKDDNIKEHYNIVLDPNITEYIIYYKKK